MGIGNLGPMEIVVILAVVILLFGGKKIPELAKGIGKGIREFKRAQSGIDEEKELPKSSETTATESSASKGE